MYNVYVFEQISPFPLPFYQLLSPGCFSCGLPIGSNDWVAGPGWLTSKDADSTLVSFVLLYHSLLCVLAAKKKVRGRWFSLKPFMTWLLNLHFCCPSSHETWFNKRTHDDLTETDSSCPRRRSRCWCSHRGPKALEGLAVWVTKSYHFGSARTSSFFNELSLCCKVLRY